MGLWQKGRHVKEAKEVPLHLPFMDDSAKSQKGEHNLGNISKKTENRSFCCKGKKGGKSRTRYGRAETLRQRESFQDAKGTSSSGIESGRTKESESIKASMFIQERQQAETARLSVGKSHPLDAPLTPGSLGSTGERQCPTQWKRNNNEGVLRERGRMKKMRRGGRAQSFLLVLQRRAGV